MNGTRRFEVDQIPDAIARKIDRMTGNIAQVWIWSGAADLRTLIRSAYFQGVQDTLEHIERRGIPADMGRL